MLISFRRLKVGLVLILAAAVAVLVRPVRSWLDQAAIQKLVGPNFSASECIVHAKDAVVEFRDFKWDIADERTIRLSAQRAWVAIETEPLLDRRVILPGAIVSDATMILGERSTSSPRLSLWKQTLANHVARIDWHELESHFNSLLAADDLQQSWGERIQAWLDRSNTIAGTTAVVDGELNSFENPLRSEVELKNRLVQLQELSDEQANISQQFAGVFQSIDNDLGQLRNLLDTDEQHIDDVVGAQCKDHELIASIARELLVNTAENVWSGLAEFAEVSDHLARASTVAIDNTQGLNVRDIRASQKPLAEIRRLDINGIFVHSDTRTPFEITSHIDLVQASAFTTRVSSLWKIRFHPEESTTSLVVSSRSEQPATIDIQLSNANEGQLGIEQCPELILASDGKTLEGMLTLPAEFLHSELDIDEGPCDFEVYGSWEKPELRLLGSVPKSLMRIAASNIEDAYAEAQSNVKMELEQRFEVRIKDLENKLRESVELNRRVTETHGEQIASSVSRVESCLSEISGAAFARRPGSIQR